MQQQQQGLTMTAACNLPGCDRPISAPNRLACGELHHLLIMAQRYHSIANTTTSAGTPHSDSPSTASSSTLLPDHPVPGSSPHQGPCAPPQQAQLLLGFSQRQSKGLCAWPSCSKPSAPPRHAWCSRHHQLEWLRAFHRSLVPDQICKRRPECTRHVFVDIDAHTGAFHIHPFCGWRHCQEYEKRVAVSHILPAPAPLPQFSTSDEGFYRREPSVKSLSKALIDYVFGMPPPKGIQVMEDFYTKHPWEVLQHPEDWCCFLIVRCKKDKEQRRELTTKDQYHWKQHGRPSKVTAEACKKYFSYRKLRGKKRNSSEISNDNPFTMVEYSIVDGEYYNKCKDYCVIKLNGPQAQTAARKRSRVQADEAANNTLPPDYAATVGDQISDYPLEPLPSIEEWDTLDLGIFEGLDLGIFEGLDSI